MHFLVVSLYLNDSNDANFNINKYASQDQVMHLNFNAEYNACSYSDNIDDQTNCPGQVNNKHYLSRHCHRTIFYTILSSGQLTYNCMQHKLHIRTLTYRLYTYMYIHKYLGFKRNFYQIFR